MPQLKVILFIDKQWKCVMGEGSPVYKSHSTASNSIDSSKCYVSGNKTQNLWVKQ